MKATTTKKSGTIAYQLYERNDLTGKSTKKNPAMGVYPMTDKDPMPIFFVMGTIFYAMDII